jgi:hypothetical protein
MLSGLIVIAGGILAASSLIIARKPNAKELIDKLTPYQGWIGICMFFWGVWELLGVVRAIGWLSTFPVQWVFWLGTGLADISVGFLLGFGLITKYTLSKSPAAVARGQQIRQRLVGYQGVLGLFAIAMGVLWILNMYVLKL